MTEAPGRRLHRLALACVTLLFAALPALVAGVGIDRPPRADELLALQEALAPAGDGNQLVRQFFAACLPGAVFPGDAHAQAGLVAVARLGQVITLLGVGFVLYLVVLLAHGRLQALLACGVLAVLPPVLREGHVLRAETLAVLFGLLSVLLLQCLAQPLRSSRWPVLSAAGLMACALFASGLAYAALPSHGAGMLVPGIVLCLAALQLAVRAVRVGREFGLWRVPVRALNERLLPWTLLSLVAPAAAIGVMWLATSGPLAAEAVAATPSEFGWWPPTWVGRVAFGALFAVGALALLLAVGVRFGRRGRIAADVVLFVYCAVTLAALPGSAEGTDCLPFAAATAVVLSSGVRAVLTASVGRVSARAASSR